MAKPATSALPAAGRGLSAIRVPVWAWALVAIALFGLYVLLQENGALLTHQQAMYIHEITHDARHALGVPCH